MSDYRRAYQAGGSYFFTVVTHARRPVLTDPTIYERLRAAFRHVAKSRPFAVAAIVVLPDHLHCLWTLPESDRDFSTRWRLIKHFVSSNAEVSINKRDEKTFWQRRFWEHLIRDEDDWRRHADYIFYNPVRHGYVRRPAEWRWSSFGRAVAAGWYNADWGSHAPHDISEMDFE